MARRADPERIQEARRIAVCNLLIDERHLTPELAEAWLASWEAEAARLGIAVAGDFWTIGLEWIVEQLTDKRRA